MAAKASRSLARTLDWFEKRLNPDQNADFMERSFTALGQKCYLLYIEGMTNSELLSEHILRPMLRCRETASGLEAKNLTVEKLLEVPSIKSQTDLEQALEALMAGNCLLLIDTLNEILVLDIRSFARRSISAPVAESVVEGPHEAFNETLRDNLTILHRIVKSPQLICKSLTVGKIPVQVSLCYIDGVCKRETVDEVLRRLEAINVDMVQSSGMLEQLLEDDPHGLLPQMVATERPDRAVSFLLEGQVLLLLDGSPRSLAMPMGFWHIFHASDDNASRWQQGTFMRIIRLIGIFCTVLFPSLFVTIVIYHPIALPMTLITSIMESRTIMPISLFGEAFLMQLIFNIINEAHTRVPGIMASSLGLVSALLMGSAAVQAALISPLLIIVVALSGLGAYCLPDYSTAFSFRMMQLAILAASWLMGLAGLILCALLFLCRIAGMTSLNQPFLAPHSPHRDHNPDLLFRKPVFRQRLRSYLANPEHSERAKGRMRGVYPRKEK